MILFLCCFVSVCDDINVEPHPLCSLQTDPTVDEVTEDIEQEQDIPFVATTVDMFDRNASDLTLVDRAMHFNHLVLELEEYASLEAVNEKSQMTIQQHVDEM